MQKIISVIRIVTYSICYFPALLVWQVKKKELLNEFNMYATNCSCKKKREYVSFLYLFAGYHEFRSLFYFRIGFLGKVLSIIYKPQISLYFYTNKKNIGDNLMIWHGFSTVINANMIGNNCQIWHQVTIGKKTTLPQNDRPTIKDNVLICSGAIVIGSIIIGNNVIIGAGAVVTKNIPDNCIVVGNPGRIINK